MLHLADLRISVIDPRLPLWKQRSITCDHLSTCDQNHLWMQKSIKDQRLPRFPISRHHLIEYQRVKVKTKALLCLQLPLRNFRKLSQFDLHTATATFKSWGGRNLEQKCLSLSFLTLMFYKILTFEINLNILSSISAGSTLLITLLFSMPAEALCWSSTAVESTLSTPLHKLHNISIPIVFYCYFPNCHIYLKLFFNL